MEKSDIQRTNAVLSLKRDKKLLLRTSLWSPICVFDWCQNRWPCV